jgi:cell division protein FtsL
MHDLIELFRGLGPPWNMIVLVMLISCAASVVKVIAKQSRTYASHRAEMNLKRDLVERGLSVDEIERVIAARSATGNGTSCG